MLLALHAARSPSLGHSRFELARCSIPRLAIDEDNVAPTDDDEMDLQFLQRRRLSDHLDDEEAIYLGLTRKAALSEESTHEGIPHMEFHVCEWRVVLIGQRARTA